MDENMNTMQEETMEPEVEVVDDDYDVDVVETPSEDHGMLKTAVKATIGLAVAAGGLFGIHKAVEKRKNKYITQTPKGLIRCK